MENTENYEKSINKKLEEGQALPEKFEVSIFSYLWQCSPLHRKQEGNIPRFLRNVSILESFSENELRIFSKFLHVRTFAPGEVVFRQDTIGVGFYFILAGNIEISCKNMPVGTKEKHMSKYIPEEYLLARLERHDYFGEMALLQDSRPRTASAVAIDNCSLIGIFKPDLNELIESHPNIGAKFIQVISVIIANRLAVLREEMNYLQDRLRKNDENQKN